MKQFINPEIIVTKFDVEDIITTSGTTGVSANDLLGWSGLDGEVIE